MSDMIVLSRAPGRRRRYTISDNITHSVRLADLPQFLNQHGFEECGGLLYAVGGETTVAASNGNYAYDPAAGTWATKAVLPILVESAVLRAVGGKLYCIGGLNDSLAVVKKCYEYNPAGDSWTEKTDMPTAREDMGSAVVDGKIYVFGGLTTSNTPTKKLEIYDPAENSWSTGADMPEAKWGGDFGCTVNGEIYAISGAASFAGYPNLTPATTVYRYDPVTDVWGERARIPIGTVYHECDVLNGIVYVVSGCTSTTTTYTNAIQSYDPARDQWSTETLLSPLAARGIGLCVYNGDLYMSGGNTVGSQKNVYKLSVGALGAELVPNGGFEGGTTGWAGLWTPGTISSATDGRTGSAGTKSMDVALPGGTTADAYATIPFETGKTYFVQVWAKNVDSDNVQYIVYSSAFASLLVGGVTSQAWTNTQGTFTGTTAAGYLVLFVNGTAGQHARFDDISIREIL